MLVAGVVRIQTNSVIDCAKPTQILYLVLRNSNFIGYFVLMIIQCRMLILKEIQNQINLYLLNLKARLVRIVMSLPALIA